MKFIFDGPPIAKARHRSKIVKEKIMTYDKQKSDKESQIIALKSQVIEAARTPEFKQELNRIAKSKVFKASLTFTLPYQKKLSKRQIKTIEDGKDFYYPNVKPDIDNYVKFYLDVANGILYKDDGQIVDLRARKKYGLVPKTEFELEPFEEII